MVSKCLGMPTEADTKELAVQANAILQAGGYGIICLPADGSLAGQVPSVYILPQEGKPPRFDFSVEDCFDRLTGKVPFI